MGMIQSSLTLLRTFTQSIDIFFKLAVVLGLTTASVHRRWILHRPDYQKILADAAKNSGATMIFDADITSIDVESGNLELKDGRTFDVDLIIGADGIKSRVRSFIPEVKDVQPQSYREKAYQTMVPREKVIKDDLTKPFITETHLWAYAASGRWILMYPIARGSCSTF